MPISSSAIQAGEAFVRMLLDDEEFAKGIEGWSNRLEQISRKARQFGTTFAAIGATLSAPFVIGTRNLLTFASELDFAAARLGVAADEFGQLATFAKLTGVELEALEIGMKTIGERIIQLQANSNETAMAFQQLGIEADQFLSVGDNWERLMMIADAMSQVKDAGLQSGLALRVLGEAGNRMLPFLRLGREGLEQMRQEMEILAPTQEMLLLSRELRIEWAKLTLGLTNLSMQLATAIGPEMRAVAGQLNDVLAILIRFAQANPILAKTWATLAGLTTTLSAIGLAAAGLSSFFSIVISGLTQVQALLLTVGKALGAIVVTAEAGVALNLAALFAVAADFGRQFADALTGVETKMLSIRNIAFGLFAMLARNLEESASLSGVFADSFVAGLKRVADVLTAIAFPQDLASVVGRAPGAGGVPPTSRRPGFAAAGIQGAFASQQTLGFAAVGVQDQILQAARDTAANTAVMATNSQDMTNFFRGMMKAE